MCHCSSRVVRQVDYSMTYWLGQGVKLVILCFLWHTTMILLIFFQSWSPHQKNLTNLFTTGFLNPAYLWSLFFYLILFVFSLVIISYSMPLSLSLTYAHTLSLIRTHSLSFSQSQDKQNANILVVKFCGPLEKCELDHFKR